MELTLLGSLLFLFLLIRALLTDLPSFIQWIHSLLPRNQINLKEKYGDWAVITGATDGIGKSYAYELAERGHKIVLIGRNKEKLMKVAAYLAYLQPRVETIILLADFSKGESIYKMLRRQLETIQVGILVNNVGIQYEYPMAIADLPESEIWDNLNVNLASTVMMSRIVLPQMIANKKGAIVNISSASSYTPQPYMNLYAAAKTYVSFFSEALRWEVSKHNITVQTVTPFYISTKINHFQPDIQKVGFFLPDTDTFVKSALDKLGVSDYTTGYFPHSLLYFLFVRLVPSFLRLKILGKRYRQYNKEFLKKQKQK